MNRQQLQKKIKQIVHQLAFEKGRVIPLDVLVKLEKLTPKLIEEWRFGRVPYLERVIVGNLSQLNFILGKIREYTGELGLKESRTERRYATHYVKAKERTTDDQDLNINQK